MEQVQEFLQLLKPTLLNVKSIQFISGLGTSQKPRAVRSHYRISLLLRVFVHIFMRGSAEVKIHLSQQSLLVWSLALSLHSPFSIMFTTQDFLKLQRDEHFKFYCCSHFLTDFPTAPDFIITDLLLQKACLCVHKMSPFPIQTISFRFIVVSTQLPATHIESNSPP